MFAAVHSVSSEVGVSNSETQVPSFTADVLASISHMPSFATHPVSTYAPGAGYFSRGDCGVWPVCATLNYA